MSANEKTLDVVTATVDKASTVVTQVNDAAHAVATTAASTKDISVGINKETIDAVHSVGATLVDSVHTILAQYGSQAADLAATYLRVDAFSHSLFPFLIALVGLYLSYKILTFNSQNVDCISDYELLRQGLTKSYNNRRGGEDSCVSMYIGANSSSVRQYTEEEADNIIERIKSNEEKIKPNLFTEPRVVYWIFALIGFVASSILGISSVFHMWSWVGMVYPELYAAHLAITAAIR